MYKKVIIKNVSEDKYEGILYEGKITKIKRYEFLPEISLSELKNKEVFLILKTNRFFFENYTITLPVYSPEIIKLKIKERINSLGYFGKEVNIYWKVVEKSDSQYRVCYLALERDFVENEIKKIKEIAGAKLQAVTFLPFSLIGSIPKDSVDKLVVHQEKDGLWLLIMSNGCLHYIEFFTVDEFLGINFDDLTKRISFLRNLYYRDTQKSINIIYTSDEHLLDMLKSLNVEIRKIESEYPEYFGISNLDWKFNFLPEEERALKKVLEVNLKISYGIFFASVILFILTLIVHRLNSEIEKKIKQQELMINDSLQRLFSQYPENKLKTYRLYLLERQKLIKIPNSDIILSQIITTFEGVKLNQFIVKKEGDKYFFLLQGEKIGTTSEAPLLAERISRRLSPNFEIKESRIDYFQAESKIIFEIKGTLRNL